MLDNKGKQKVDFNKGNIWGQTGSFSWTVNFFPSPLGAFLPGVLLGKLDFYWMLILFKGSNYQNMQSYFWIRNIWGKARIK